MSTSNIKYPKLDDFCLKATVRRELIFSLTTNLSQLGGPGLNFLSESLMSSEKANKRIIELIMFENQYVFRTPDAIRKIMNDDWPVSQAFIMLGNHNLHCNLSWLICCLYRLAEMLPLKDILYGAPPWIRKLNPKMTIIEAGDKIVYEIRTVSSTDINWWKSDSHGTSSFGETIHLDECSVNRVSYTVKPEDTGYFFIVAVSLRTFHETSDKVFVGKEDTELYVKAYSEVNDKITRVALLIGIMTYKYSTELKAPKCDIAELDPILRKIGFKVHNFTDLNLEQLKNVLETFSTKYASENTYVFFYFAGHGMSVDKKDYVQLTDNSKLDIIEILNIMSKPKPTVLLAIFDMCRNDVNIKDTKRMTITESLLPINDSIMLVMSTFPLEKAFELERKYESHSQIIKPLCNCLLTYACTEPINIAMAYFVSDPSITGQKPVFYSGPMCHVIGKKDFCVPVFQPKILWVKEEIDLHFEFDVFHNLLSITLHETSGDLFRKRDFGSNEINESVKKMTFNLFNMKRFVDEKSFKLRVHRTVEGSSIKREIPFKIILPSDMFDFFV